jgi:cyclase
LDNRQASPVGFVFLAQIRDGRVCAFHVAIYFPRMRIVLAGVISLLFLAQSGRVLYSQTAKTPGPLRTEKIKGDLYMISGEGGNVAMLSTSEGVLLVDNMFDRNHAGILEQVKTVTGRPLRYVINTHQHDDHAGGDFKMLPLAEVIAHRNVRRNLEDIKQPYYEDTPGTPIGLPRITFTDQLAVSLGRNDVQALYFGRGHTSGDAIVYFPALKTIHTGDLYLSFRQAAGRGGAPTPPRPPGVPVYVDYAQGGSFIEWSRTLDRTLALDFDTVISGHGPVTTKADLQRFRDDLVTMRTRLQSLVKQGTSRAELVRTLEVDYGWRSTGCPPSPPTPGCLQYQQVDSLIAELK